MARRFKISRREFRHEDRGLALTEYLLLIGLLLALVLTSAYTFGLSLGTAWSGWGNFYDSTEEAAATAEAVASGKPARSGRPCQNGIDNGNAEVSNCGGNRAP